MNSHASAALPNDPDAIYLTARQVLARYGDISEMTLHRWLRDDRMAFPRPHYFGRLRFWRLDQLERWERERAPQRT